MIDLGIANIREQFPILQRPVGNSRLAYLDSAATTQKPNKVIQAIVQYYEHYNANVHRGLYTLSEEATAQFERGRKLLGQWIGAQNPEQEIVFTKGATEAINLIANGLAPQLKSDDEILISTLEHHANIVPWQQVANSTGAKIRVIPMHDNGQLDMDAYENLLSDATKVVAVNGISNALGTINPIREMVEKAHQFGAIFVCDATQMAPHRPINVVEIDCDFLVMSGHKMYGPTGIGLCYGKSEQLAKLSVYQTGGEMIDVVSFEGTSFKSSPYCFEAGTPHIAGVIGWMAAVEFLSEVNYSELVKHENELLVELDEGLDRIPEVKRYSCAKDKAAVAAFAVEGCHPQDVATLLDTFGVAVRSGHHCTMPLMKRLGVAGLLRASLAVYTNSEDIQQLLAALPKVAGMLK